MTGMSVKGAGIISKLVLKHGSNIVIEKFVVTELESAAAVRLMLYV